MKKDAYLVMEEEKKHGRAKDVALSLFGLFYPIYERRIAHPVRRRSNERLDNLVSLIRSGRDQFQLIFYLVFRQIDNVGFDKIANRNWPSTLYNQCKTASIMVGRHQFFINFLAEIQKKKELNTKQPEKVLPNLVKTNQHQPNNQTCRLTDLQQRKRERPIAERERERPFVVVATLPRRLCFLAFVAERERFNGSLEI